MAKRTVFRCEVKRQRGHDIATDIPLNGGEISKDDITASVSEVLSGECRLGKIDLNISDQELEICDDLDMPAPVRLFIPMSEKPLNITALYMFSSWWSRPAFVQSPADMPDKTQVALFEYRDRYACFVPMVGNDFKAYLTGGTESELQLVLTALCGGISQVREPLYLYAEAQSVDEAITKVFRELARVKNIRTREQRRLPEMFRYLGWCSWDAFYTDVNETGIRQKAAEFAEKQIPVKWIIIDDGWLTLKNRLLYDYHPDPEKFPDGFTKMTEDIKSATSVKWFGVWHALMGYWSGISPDSPVAVQEAEYLCRTMNGRLVPDPERGEGFYRDWYRVLNDQGISFVKVDGQGTIPLCFENTVPLAEAARGLHSALESGAARMDGAVINCMGMAMENILSRPATSISRNSDDFSPKREDSFKEHLLENAYNALYHDQINCCDWDMFWTNHPDGKKHALLRAISGGPVYFSDRVGETVPEVLRPLCYADGELLRMDRSAKPTDDCVFADPMATGFLKLQNTARYGKNLIGGGIAVFSLTDKDISCSLSPARISGITKRDRYAVYDYFSGKVRYVGYDKPVECTVEGGGFRWFVILPVTGSCTCFGLTDKYVGFAAVESINDGENRQTVILCGSGTITWATDRSPKHVEVNGQDMTDHVQTDGGLIRLPLTEKAAQTIVEVQF